jgi:hypothetical protein
MEWAGEMFGVKDELAPIIGAVFAEASSGNMWSLEQFVIEFVCLPKCFSKLVSCKTPEISRAKLHLFSASSSASFQLFNFHS